MEDKALFSHYFDASILCCKNFKDLQKHLHLNLLNGIILDETLDIKCIINEIEQFSSFIRPPICLLGSKKINVDKAMELAKLGIDHYMLKPVDLDNIIRKISPNIFQYDELKNIATSYFEFGDPPILPIHILKQIPLLAKSPYIILIQGETGIGKGYLTKLIHEYSKGKSKKMISVNCASIPENLFESEFFGTVDGAFTDAKNKMGYLESVVDGTLFLDEIGEMSLYNQTKLLKVLEERFFYRLGCQKKRLFTGRVICATHRNLKKMVSKGLFRKDLFYRINILNIELPPLRKRLGEIPMHIKRILYSHTSNKSISHQAVLKLINHKWKGNIRELQSVIMRADVLSEKSNIIEVKHIQF
ncbi:MAG: sigma 54-interacting transcriptional regulator [Bacteroidales bacterium]|nr:sigma 54-interacting transcriptional regulator [Bacteroidales bacterium]